jgi:hypothetical protein
VSEYPPEAWQRMSRLLKSRRVRLSATYRNRTEFCKATGLHYKLVQDIEGAPGTRTNFTDETFALFEGAYQLGEGSFRRTMEGGPLEPQTAEPLAEVPPESTSPEPVDFQSASREEPPSPIASYLQGLIERVDQRLEELNRKLDERDRQIEERDLQIQELLRERQRDTEDEQRKGA